MVDYVHSMIDHTKRKITISYHVALAMVAAIILMIAAITNHLVAAQVLDASIINISGKQRMLSQRIALLARDVSDASGQERTTIRQELLNAITTMEHNHALLIADSHSDDNLEEDNRLLHALYFEPPLMLDQQVKEYIAHAHAVLAHAEDGRTQDEPDMVPLQKLARGRLLGSLDAAVRRYEGQTVERFHLLYHVVVGLALFGVALLVVIALVVFKPAIAFIEQAQKRMAELNQLKGDFLANMSHEIRTPMNGIFGMAELLLDSQLTTRQQHYARTLQSSADHLLGLINDILDFSKLEAGQMKLDTTRFNLLLTMEDVVELLASRARVKSLELLMRYAPGTPRVVVADAGRIRQILFNLIGNAIKFTDQGYVMVHTEILAPDKAPDTRLWLQIRIEDTGIGIPDDKIDGIFEKFMQVETGSTRARQGTGLGLAICRNLILLMGGQISVESRLGKGTVFTCRIPIDDYADPQPAVDRQKMLAGKRVVLVDDLAPNRMLYREALTAAGMECLLAENAEEALSILTDEYENHRIVHAMITDYMMPVVDGLRLTRTVKANVKFARMPVIILTSAGEQGLVRQFDESGASACLFKPATRQQLYETLAHVIELAARGATQGIIPPEIHTSGTRRLLLRERPLYGTHLLLVEDNRVNLEITTEMLHQFGCEVTTATNGFEAITAVRRQAFDLIFMDCQMPEMDGFEAARRIVALKQSGDIAEVPMVALTANALKGDRERCLEAGMDDYISKPMRKGNLEAILLKWLQRHLEERALISYPPEVSPEKPLPSSSNPADYGIDVAAFTTARDMLGNKLPTILAYYLEDAQGYVERIAEAVARHDLTAAIAPSHTLKSSSRQLGARQLAQLAEQVEQLARGSGAQSLEEIEKLLVPLRHALSNIRPFLQQLLGA